MIHPKNLLIVRTDRIGDVVLSLPIAGLVKKKYPDCRITFLLRSYTKALAANNPYVDEILTLKESGGIILFWENIKQIKEKKFDSAIIVYPTFKSALIIFLSQLKFRIGTGYRWYSILFNEKLFEHRKYAGKHELEFNIQLLQKFGINENINTENVEFNLAPEPLAEKNVEKTLSAFEVKKNVPIIIFHPGSGGSAIDLPVDKLKELVNMSVSQLVAEIWITGSEDESELCERIASGTAAKNFAGKFDLQELIALINKSDIFVSNSTGPLHIAAALGKYTIGFYPKILACSPQRWGPYTSKKVVFLPQIECRDCTREQCERLSCMSSINIEEVFNSISKISKSIHVNGEKNV